MGIGDWGVGGWGVGVGGGGTGHHTAPAPPQPPHQQKNII